MTQPSTNIRRLYRSRGDRMVAGIAGGLGEYFQVDATWLRLALIVVGALSLGTLLVVYVIAWLIIPENPVVTVPPAHRLHRSSQQRMIGGVCGGLAETWKVDPTLLRLGMVVLTLVTGGLWLGAYLAAWLVMPSDAPALPATGQPVETLPQVKPPALEEHPPA